MKLGSQQYARPGQRYFSTARRGSGLCRGTGRKSSALAAAALSALLLSACGSDKSGVDPVPESSEAAVTSVPVTTTPSSAAASPTPSHAASAEPEPVGSEKEDKRGASASSTASSTARAGEFNEDVQAVYAIFSPIAPASLFAQFDSCDEMGEHNFNCSGTKVGQFQFSKSSTRAAQTTQVLTELRSSTVLEDDGNHVTGWSTLGSTAVLTVVDNRQGLVLQQMISTDQDDPEKRLTELGLYSPSN